MVHGDADFGVEVMTSGDVQAAYESALEAGVCGRDARRCASGWKASRRRRDLKRGFGGLVDVEFLVQLSDEVRPPIASLRTPNTWEALEALHTTQLIDGADYDGLRRATISCV